MTLNALFHRQAATVRDTETVSVIRELSPEQHILYRKRFRASGFDVWAERENQFFGLFSFKKLHKVVRPETVKNTEQGGVAEVVTFDAGLTIEEWLQVGARLDNQTILSQPFLLGEYWLRLAHACLLALQEIHAIGVIHCDIKPDNICLPYSPKKLSHDLNEPIQIDFEHIRLIDFSFSLSKDIPLQNAVLPINSQHPSAMYMAPAFRKAILVDQSQQQTNEVNKLDYRVDLYSLGYLLNTLLNQANMIWETQQQLFAQQLVLDLMNPASSNGLPHEQWIKQLAEQLTHFNQITHFNICTPPISQTPTIAATPILTTPIIATAVGDNTINHKAKTQKNNSKWRVKTIVAAVLVAAGIAWYFQPESSEKPITHKTAQEPQVKPKKSEQQPTSEETGSLGIFESLFKTEPEPEAVVEIIDKSEQQNSNTVEITSHPIESKNPPCKQCPKESIIPAGSFQMGSSANKNEQPVHEVNINYSFAVTRYEITVTEYFNCVSDGACQQPEWNEFGSDYNYVTGTSDAYRQLAGTFKEANYPILGVSWFDAVNYAKWLSKKTGLKYRLLSEAEWEYACRANTNTQYCGNENIKNIAWFKNNSSRKTHAVGSKPANAFGLYDMSGNASEWVADHWSNNYLLAPNNGSALHVQNNKNVKRGGSWNSNNDEARASARDSQASGERSTDTGFRLARTLP